MMKLSPEVQKAAEFLENEIQRNPFSEVGIKLIAHDGKITRLEKTIIMKSKPTLNGGEYGRQNTR